MSVFNVAMRTTLLKKLAEDAAFVGFALSRRRQMEGITVEEQAQVLGLDLDGLVRLSLCRVPRRRHCQRDLGTIARYVGVREDVLADLLRSSS